MNEPATGRRLGRGLAALIGDAGEDMPTSTRPARVRSGRNVPVAFLRPNPRNPRRSFDDADLDNAVSGALLGNFYTQGQICTNGTRVFVHEAVKDAFVEKLLARTRKMILGDPLDPQTHVGPLISEGHMQHVLRYIETGKAEGGQVLIGGERARVAGFENGNFVAATVFD